MNPVLSTIIILFILIGSFAGLAIFLYANWRNQKEAGRRMMERLNNLRTITEPQFILAWNVNDREMDIRKFELEEDLKAVGNQWFLNGWIYVEVIDKARDETMNEYFNRAVQYMNHKLNQWEKEMQGKVDEPSFRGGVKNQMGYLQVDEGVHQWGDWFQRN